MSLKKKVIKGGIYLSIANVFAQFVAIGVNIILARLLLPKDFGIIALAVTYMGFISLFTNIGFGAAIIHERNPSQIKLSSIYWINFIFSFTTFILIVLSAPLATKFYDEPELRDIIWYSALTILITPFYITHYKLEEKKINFKLLSKIKLTATFFGALAAVVSAYFGLGVYSLANQLIASTIVKLILVLIFSDWRPNFILHLREIREMIWFSLKYKASNSILYLERNVDYLILGKLFNAEILGYYSFSYNIMYTPVKRISYIFSEILFPSFSSIKEQPERIIRGYFKSVQLIAMVSFPIMTLISLNAPLLINFIFGAKWDGAIPIIEVLCFAGAIQSISQIGSVIFPSIGKPEVDIYLSVSRTILLVIAIFAGSYIGIVAVAYFILCAKALSFAITLGFVHRFISFSLKELFSSLKGSLMGVGLMFIVQGISIYYTEISSLYKLIIMSAVAGIFILTYYYSIIKELLIAIRTKSNV
jgi:O-antigen/teichoic acid export membrane protein